MEKELIDLREEDITKSNIFDLFAYFFNEETKKMVRKHNPNDKLVIPKGKYHNNDKNITTTVGRFIFNVFLIEKDFYNIFGYINNVIDAKTFEKIDSRLSLALLNDEITPKQMSHFYNKVQWMGFTFNTILCPSLTPKTVVPLDAVEKRKSQLVKQYEEDLKKGSVVTASRIEKELLDIAKKEIGNDPGLELYESGSKASFDNNYKSLFVMKGPIVNAGTGEYSVSTSNYMNGVKKDEIEYYADSIVNGAFAKGKNTQVGGYMTKKYFAAFQSLVLDKKGTDCHSKRTHSIFLTESNHMLFLYRYIVEGNKLVLLDDETIKKYIGRKVNMRDPIYCTNDKFCNVCAGDLYYKLGIEYIGLTSPKISSSIMNKSLKKFHDTSIKLTKINVEDL